MVAQAGASSLPLGLPALGPHLRGEFGLSLAWLGVLLATPTIGYALTMFAWGALADRFGERPVLVGGLAGCGAVLVAASAAGSPVVLGVMLVGAAALGACAPVASGRAVVAWFPVAERGRALGLRHTAPMAGGAIGAVVLPAAAAVAGTAGAMVALACMAGVGALASWGVPEPPGGGEPGPRGAVRGHPAGDRLVWLLAAGGALVIVGQAVLLRFQPSYLHDERGWSEGAAAAMLSATLLAAAGARVVAGMVSDRHGNRIAVLRGQALGAGALLLGTGLLLGLPSVVAALLLLGAAVLTMAGNGVAYAAVAEVAPDRTGAALGLYATVLIVVVSVAPAVFGLVAGDVPWTLAFAALAAFPAAGGLVLVRADRLNRRRAAGPPMPSGAPATAVEGA
ncbi:MAG: MFS transporter [Thermoleophilia bacterium]|nr:MFS transporter [Thermoleophilia bacterium]